MSRRIVVVAVACVAVGFYAVARERPTPADKMKSSGEALLDVTHRGLALAEQTQPGGRDVYLWSKRLLSAELDLSRSPEERIAARERFLKQVTTLEQLAKDRHQRSVINKEEVLEAEYHRCDAELQLELERAATGGPRK